MVLYRNSQTISFNQKEKYAHRRNVTFGLIKAHYNIEETRPSNVNCGNITHAWPYNGAITVALFVFFGLLVMSALDFKPRMDLLISCFVTQIHLWYNICLMMVARDVKIQYQFEIEKYVFSGNDLLFEFNFWIEWQWVCSGGSRISPRRGRQLPGGAPTYEFVNFRRKLHENEEILATGGGGGRPLRHPLDPPLVWTHHFVLGYQVQSFPCTLWKCD